MEEANNNATASVGTDTAAVTPVTATEVQPPKSGWENVKEVGGIDISIVGMTIVFIGLVLTSLYIASLPYLAGEKSEGSRQEGKSTGTQNRFHRRQ